MAFSFKLKRFDVEALMEKFFGVKFNYEPENKGRENYINWVCALHQASNLIWLNAFKDDDYDPFLIRSFEVLISKENDEELIKVRC